MRFMTRKQQQPQPASPSPTPEPKPKPRRQRQPAPRKHSQPKIKHPSFGARTRIHRCTGKASRYASDCVRVLPTSQPDQAAIEATDGHQALCIFGPGQLDRPYLVGPDVLPTRERSNFTHIQLAHGAWQSSEGRLAPLTDGVANFPQLGEVLPKVQQVLDQDKLQRGKGIKPGQPVHVMLGINVDLLRKQAEGLGTSKLLLFIEVPKGLPKDGEAVAVNKPVAVAPAVDEGVAGVGAVMPLTPSRDHRNYEKLREAVIDAEGSV